jgi:hypothetical protein
MRRIWSEECSFGVSRNQAANRFTASEEADAAEGGAKLRASSSTIRADPVTQPNAAYAAGVDLGACQAQFIGVLLRAMRRKAQGIVEAFCSIAGAT